MFDALYTHVKWFTEEFLPPMSMAEVITPAFLFWYGVTLAGLFLAAVFNEPLQRIGFIAAIHRGLDRAKPYITVILRIGLGIGLALQLFYRSYLAPELEAGQTHLLALLILAILGLLLRRTLIVSAGALLVLYIHAIAEYGLFHSLDYVFYLGIIYYLIVCNTKWKETATPALYFFTGLSLAWLGIEKLTIPDMSYSVIEEFGIPTFGFSKEHFVLISAFVELGLAWTFIMGILNRFISILVTLVFITTTTVFGFTEIVGHTIVHTLLIVFLIKGEGAFKTPFQFHHAPALRYLFVIVNFSLLLFGLMWIYVVMGGGGA